MSREQILARMNEIANADLTDVLMDEYERLEKDLEGSARRDALQQRNALANSANPGINADDAATLVNPEYRAAFNSYLRTGIINNDLVQSRAQSKGVTTEGGFLVPADFRQQLIERMKAFGGISEVAETISTGDGRDLPWPTIDDTANLGEIVLEGNSFVAGADLVFGSNTLKAYSYASGGAGGLALRVSYELAQDALFDIEGLVSRKLAERIARIQAVHLVNGTGVNQPLGIKTGLTGVQTVANTGVTYKDLLRYVHSVDPAYRANARWAMNDKSLEYFQGILDTTGRPILKTQNDGIDGAPGGSTLLGYPVTIDQAFPDMVLTSATILWGVFGDLAEGYAVRRVQQVELLVNPYSRMNNRQIEYSAWARMDATQQNINAYVALTNHV